MQDILIEKDSYKDLPKLVEFYISSEVEQICLSYCSNSPEFSLVRGFVLEALRHEARAFILIKGVPFCLLREADDHIRNDTSQHKTKKGLCKKCRYDSRCGGLWKNHNLNQLVPILDKPEEIVIELTNRCNLECSFCFNQKIYPKGKSFDLSESTVQKVIDQAVALRVEHVRFSGGEPMLHKGLVSFMKYSKDKGLRVKLNTNGALVDENLVSQMTGILDNVLIPLNSYDRAEEKKTTGNDSLNKKISALALFQKAKVPIVRAGTMATKKSIQNLEKFLPIIDKMKIKYWELYRPILSQRTELDLSPDDVRKLIVKLLAFYKRNGIVYPIANALPFCCYEPEKINFVSLGARYDDGHSRLVVDARGYVRPSYFIDENLGRADYLKACWNTDFVRSMRNLLFLPEECGDCCYRYKCMGGLCFLNFTATRRVNH